jgi:hypothetical protein
VAEADGWLLDKEGDGWLLDKEGDEWISRDGWLSTEMGG